MSKKTQSCLLRDRKMLFAKTSTVVMTGLTMGMILINLAWSVGSLQNGTVPAGNTALLKFASYSELKAYLNNTVNWWPYYNDVKRSGGIFPSASTAAEGYAVDYSKTNIQVEGVDEADIVKSDGEYLYVALGERVLIVKAYPAADAHVVTEIKLNGTIAGLFINEDRLVVFEYGMQAISYTRAEETMIYNENLLHIRIYDVTDRNSPVLARTVSSDGWYFTSRMIGDYVYVVVNEYAYLREGEVPLPIIINQGQREEVSATSIYYTNVSDYSYGFTTIIAVNVKDDNVEPGHETFLIGNSGGIYASLNNSYLAVPRYDYETGAEATQIHRLGIQEDKITCEASGEVPGRILNQFSMDEYNGYFRIATTMGQVSRMLTEASSSNNLYVLNMNLTIVGRLEDLAPGEQIYSARFMGDQCYLVTFKKIDPLFVIGLEDPANPTVLGRLKIPGYSNYLHPYSENLLIGIGKETVEAEEGDFAWYQGVKISLFDVSDLANPREAAKYEIGDRGTDSPILSDHKALLFDKERNLLAIPVLVAEIDETKYSGEVPDNAYGDYVYQGLYVFSITEDSISLRGRITHMDNEDEFMKSGYYFYSEYSVFRALYIEDLLYTLSNKRIEINNLTTLEPISQIELP
jgi:inhibitor of cysteine peptidase